MLFLNPDKTKLIVYGSPQMKSKLQDFRTTLLGKELLPVDTVKDLGVVFDSKLSFNVHIIKTASFCMSALGQINRVKHIFRKDILVTIINFLVFSKFYYCSSVWSNTSASNIHKLQGVQNFAARIVSGTRKFDHVSPALKDLRRIPVKSHPYLWDAILAFKSITGEVPNYLSSNLFLNLIKTLSITKYLLTILTYKQCMVLMLLTKLYSTYKTILTYNVRYLRY